MNYRNIALIGAFLLCAPLFGNTYYAGFEDTRGGDYDYNDIVFSITGNGLKLHSSASFFTQPVLNNSSSPFWNNYSQDKPSNAYNIGFCIYGGGACNGGTGLSPNAEYLAANRSKTGSANDVTFSVDGKVSTDLLVQVRSISDKLGFYLVSDPTHVLSLSAVGVNLYSFSPTGAFGLVGIVNGSTDFYSQTNLGTTDSVSHFAFFTPAPEPGMIGLVGAGLLIVGAFSRRKKN